MQKMKLFLLFSILPLFILSCDNFVNKKKSNPLLQEMVLIGFDKIKPKHFKSAIEKGIKENRKTIEKLLAQKNYTWNNFVAPLDEANERLNLIWVTIDHLNAVTGTKEIRKAHEECVPMITKYLAEVAQDERIYQAIKKIQESKSYKSLKPVQKRILDKKIEDFYLAGVSLSPEKKKRFSYLKQRLAELSGKFSSNVMNATQKYSITLTEKDTKGLPESAIALGKKNAKKRDKEGFVFTLDGPSVRSLLTYADSRDLRKKVYIDYITRASANGWNTEWDNSKVIEEMLGIRKELADILSLNNFAEYSLAKRMAKDAKEVSDFLNNIAKKSLPKAKKELQELQDVAANDGIKKIKPWDIGYYAEKLKQKKFNFSGEKLRAYFPEPQVMKGMFDVIENLYGVTFKEKKETSVWHEDVRCFELRDFQDNLLGYIYIDLYYRDNKRGGAWMDEKAPKRYVSNDGELHLPVTYLMCNFSPSIDDKPALLTHGEVLILLHEIGHCLQHLLTKVDYLSASGTIGIPEDGVEVASQFMENWGWQKDGIKLFSKHHESGESLPQDMLGQLIAAKTFLSGISTLRQLEFSLIDFNVHLNNAATMEEVEDIIEDVRGKVRVVPSYKEDMVLHYFLHPFVWGLEAGYYGYMWSEVLSSDLFSKFEEEGILNRDTGEDFLREFLELGGSKDPLVLFRNFRGREPKIDAFLRYRGIAKDDI